MNFLRITVRIHIGLAVLMLLPHFAFAQWIPDGAPVCAVAQDQTLQQMASDGSGGAIVVWSDGRTGNGDIYAQRIDENGIPLWALTGAPVCTLASYNQSEPGIVSDGAGGAIVVWSDGRTGNGDIYAQRIDGSGNTLWTPDGVRMSFDLDPQLLVRIVSDGAGGAIVSWRIIPIGAPPYGIGVASVDVNGNVRCCEVSIGNGEGHEMVSDGAGSAIVTWSSNQSGSWDILAQKVDTTGVTPWGPAVSIGYGAMDQLYPQIVSDGSGGVIITWFDRASWNIYAQRINPGGSTLWTANGIGVCTQINDQTNPQLTADGAGGAIVAWQDKRGGGWNIYAQNVDTNGNLLWNPDGIAVCTAAGDQQEIRLVTDGNGGAIATWEDFRAEPNQGIYAQRLDAAGTPLWSTNGIGICTASGDQITPELVPKINGGAIISWTDPRNGDYDIYAQRIYADSCNVSPASLDFGTVTIGSYSEQTFTIENTAGIGTLSGTVHEPCADYSIVSGSGAYSLAPGESRLVTVRFEPTSAGTQLCTVYTGDALCSNVSCTGVGGCQSGVVYVDTDATGNENGTSWTDAFTDLQDALWLAGICSGVTEIWMAEGTYLPTEGSDRSATFALQNGLALYGGFAGTETLLGERDITAHPTTLNGSIGAPVLTDNCYHVVTASNTDATAVLDGFTVSWGYADGVDDDGFGGGLFIENGNPTISNATIRDNHASGGGGMYKDEGSPALDHVTFELNSCDGLGGGLHDFGGSTQLTNVRFLSNTAGSGGGGMHTAGNPFIVNTVFSDNTAGSGGGINTWGSFFSMVNCTFAGNTATSGAGAMSNSFSAPVLTNLIMWGNTAPAIDRYKGTAAMISYSLIQGCGGSGGGWNGAYGTDGGNNIDSDPMFLGDDWPATPTSIYSSSPALNAGDNSAVPGAVTTDLAGNPRIHGGTVDLGAYECQGPATATSTPVAPESFALHPNVPNPFNPATTIHYDVPAGGGNVTLHIYDVAGRLVRTLVDDSQTAGQKTIGWNGTNNTGTRVASGVYFYRMKAPGFTQTRKMVLLQ